MRPVPRDYRQAQASWPGGLLPARFLGPTPGPIVPDMPAEDRAANKALAAKKLARKAAPKPDLVKKAATKRPLAKAAPARKAAPRKPRG